MPTYASFDEISQIALAYFEKEETLQAAYDLLTEAAPQFPEQTALIYNWRYCAAAMMNKTHLALQLIQESLEAGFWWSAAYLKSDDDLKSLQDLPEFNQLVEISEAKYQAAQASTKPLALPLPLPAESAQALPLLLALHGNNENAQRSRPSWESAVEHGWLTVMLQSSQTSNPEAYVWDDLEKGAEEIKAHYHELLEKYQLDSRKVVVGGFSKGGEMAIWLALMEVIPLAGFIAVNPGGPFFPEVDKWLPLLESCKTRAEMRAYLLAGEQDQNLESIKTLHKMLNSHELACQLVIAPAIAHTFPEDFDQILAQALEYIHG